MTPIGLAPPPPDTELHDPALAEIGAGAQPFIPIHARRSLPQRFVGPPLWISVAAHALVLAALLLYVRFGPESTPRAPISGGTVQYVVDVVLPSELAPGLEAAPPASEPEQAAAPASTGAAPATPAPSTAPSAPQVITSQGGEQTVPAAQERGDGGGASVSERLRPGFSDPRLYADPKIARLREPGLSDAAEYRRHFQARIDALNDSLYGGSGPNTDWTVKDGSGDRWGISEDGVHLGPLTIPRALVPFPAASGKNQDLEQEREQRRQREEIQRQEADRERRRALQERNAEAGERREQEQREGGDPGG